MPVAVVTEIDAFRSYLNDMRREGRTIGLVPTMGFLHDGHLSLMARSVAERNITAVTIFVNPLQFAANEDLAAYPRDLPRDIEMCDGVGAAVILAPPVEEIYPEPMLTTVAVAALGESMEGESRPEHFAGVAAVVAKLFNIAGPCHAYFGEKDYQQLIIIRRLASDLNFPVTVVGCPIEREPDGLAMSSRNVYLSPDERASATVLYRAMRVGAEAVAEGERDTGAVVEMIADLIESEPLAQLGYVEVVEDGAVTVPDKLAGDVRMLVAARFGKPRLLDNLLVRVPG